MKETHGGCAQVRVTLCVCTSECSAGGVCESTLGVFPEDGNMCQCNVHMERELKGVPRGAPIGQGKLTGSKGSAVGQRAWNEVHLQESD